MKWRSSPGETFLLKGIWALSGLLGQNLACLFLNIINEYQRTKISHLETDPKASLIILCGKM